MNQSLVTPGVKDTYAGAVIEAAAQGKYADPKILESIVACAAAAFGGKAGKETDLIPTGVVPFVDKVIFESFKVLDRDFEVLNAAGYSDDEVTDIALAAAAGAAMGRLQMGLSAMGKQI